MRKPGIRLLLLSVLIICSAVSSRAATAYQQATILSVRQQLRTETSDTMRDYLLDTTLVTTTRLVYIFEVRRGNEIYDSEYLVPSAPQPAPKEWNPQVEIRIQGRRMFIQEPDGTQLETRIVSHTKS
jgi:hypothetical protein